VEFAPQTHVQFMSTDRTFITNEDGQSLLERFRVRMVEQIVTVKERDAGADVSALEREIDELVHTLYNLTSAEIILVEEATRR
jgi:hypothetical protein